VDRESGLDVVTSTAGATVLTGTAPATPIGPTTFERTCVVLPSASVAVSSTEKNLPSAEWSLGHVHEFGGGGGGGGGPPVTLGANAA
jgi:hypothetical protein